jgi:formylglycine-generating enzyme required for sulfatase activity
MRTSTIKRSTAPEYAAIMDHNDDFLKDMQPINYDVNQREKGNIDPLLFKKFLLVTTIAILAIMSFPLLKSGYDRIFPNEAHSDMIATQSGDSFGKVQLPELVLIPAGSFEMGEQDAAFINELSADEKKYFGVPGKRVQISEPFYLSKTEITNEQFASYVQVQQPGDQVDQKIINYSRSKNNGQFPVAEISWRGAMAYAAWLGEQTQRSCRLPTEVEWEYAARGGGNTAYPWGDIIGVNNANCNGCGGEWNGQQVAPVGQFQANAFGLYDMSGNVWEWTCSVWRDQYDGQEQQCARMENFDARVVRGGSWGYGPKYVRTTARGEFGADIRYNGFGFRVMCSSTIE